MTSQIHSAKVASRFFPANSPNQPFARLSHQADTRHTFDSKRHCNVLDPDSADRPSRKRIAYRALLHVPSRVAAMALDSIVQDPGLENVLQTSNQSRDQAAGLADLLLQADEAGPHARTPELDAALSKQQKLLFTNISHLRGLHRAAQFAARDTKAQTAESRQEVDRLHLQLQNLYYEQRHLQGEIAACESYE